MKVCTDSCLFGAWTASLLEAQKPDFAPATLLDIGAGTGLLSLMIAQKTTGQITAVELDPDAFKQAEENIAASPWGNRIRAIHSDILDFVCEKKFDFIFSNPPFFENDLRSTDHRKNIAKHHDGLSLLQLTDEIADRLSADGQASILLPFHRMEEAEKIANNHGLFASEICMVQHTPAHPFFRVMFWFTKKDVQPSEKKLSIRNTDGQYSDDFSKLLKEYYLQF